MARPPPLGTPGAITVVEDCPGVCVARCRFGDHDHDHDGVTRRLWNLGTSRTRARNGWHKDIEDRQRSASRAGVLSPASVFVEAAEVYLTKIARSRSGLATRPGPSPARPACPES